MYLELAYLGWMVGKYIYHRLTDDPPVDTRPKEITLPKTEEGGAVPLLFGRDRIRRPVVVWHGGASYSTSTSSPTGASYTIHMLRVEAIRIPDGDVRFCNAWSGDRKCNGFIEGSPWPPALGTQVVVNTGVENEDPEWIGMKCEFGDGNPLQDMSVGSFAAGRMIIDGIPASNIPGFQGYITVGMEVGRLTASLPDIQFELSTFPPTISPYYHTPTIPMPNLSPRVVEHPNFPDVWDLNPASAIAAVLCDPFGKLGRDPNEVIDGPSFRKAHQTLNAERHGYSRVWDQRTAARDIISDILKQTDGLLYEEPTTGLWVYKLIRPDFSYTDLRLIHPGNCVDVDNHAAGGWTDTVNTLTILFEDRYDDYKDGTASSQNQANVFGQGSEQNDLVIEMRGIKTKQLADAVVAREIAARSRPLMRCRVTVSREFYAARPGDRFRMTWPDLNMSGVVMIAVDVNLGQADENTVMIDLMQDFHYTYKKLVSTGGVTGGGFGSGGVLDPG